MWNFCTRGEDADDDAVMHKRSSNSSNESCFHNEIPYMLGFNHLMLDGKLQMEIRLIIRSS